ncbi:MAG: hypothetical protein IJU76_10250 [Desulfovibrionaceae bacterium]|nr:hypothetical protein [Desulfovibrionaceae bacterium]
MNSLNGADETVDLRLKAAYSLLLVPYVDRASGTWDIIWTVSPVNIEKGLFGIRQKLESEENLISRWGPQLLIMELVNLLWKEKGTVRIGDLWDSLCRYCYCHVLPDILFCRIPFVKV